MTARQIPPGMDQPDCYDYEGLQRLAHKENRPVLTLIALAPANDPFYISPARQERAEWFTALWRKFVGTDTGIHVRRLHYRLISQKKNVLMRNGTPYRNDPNCWQELCMASQDARYTNMVPMEAFVDRRNPEAIINIQDTGEPTVSVSSEDIDMPSMPEPPELTLDDDQKPTQYYQIEIWAEKSTMNDILLPLAERYGINFVTGAGELSITACDLFIERVKADGRPVRILYISDFDPAGRSMPVAVARKIEFMIHNEELDIDVQVRSVVLTPEQCVEYALPRTPIKDTEDRAANFEEQHGEGATELDALEALHPGELERILKREIARYYDDGLAEQAEDEAEFFRKELETVNSEVHGQHAEDIASLREEYAALVAAHTRWTERAETVWHAIAIGLEAGKPAEPDWPEPDEGDEDPDPLYDSTRDYIGQIDRYKEFQGKTTERKPGRGSGRPSDTPRARTGDKTKLILALLKRKRPRGCTRKEVLEATGWKAVSMQQQAAILGVTLAVEKLPGELTRYYVE